ncbi:hypothetical protein CL628_03955 [bacterium]|nr:hypothetical protein [bacterium]|tara:strand:+ start:1372 stop:1782 length:411 start_codon:yes stop_codon:yes gene_type:complete
MRSFSVHGALAHPLPISGVVTAGWPSPAEEELGDVLSFEEWLLPNREAMCLITVTTDAMVGAGIHQGDHVIVQRGRRAQPDDIVVAEVDGTTLIRQLVHRGGVPTLVAAHDSYTSTACDLHTRMLGVVTAVIRKYR